YPIIVERALEPHTQQTIGTFTLSSAINQHSKGTNMSIFLEQIEERKMDGYRVGLNNLNEFGLALSNRLQHERVTVEVAFPWFDEQISPKSAKSSLNYANISISLSQLENNQTEYSATMEATITTLCPCSKEISEYSAHSQRGKVTMEVTFTDGFEFT